MLIRTAVILSVLLFAPLAATGQTIDYEIPSEYDLVPGRLSVTFADSVPEEAARQLLAEAGDYEIVDAAFPPLRFVAQGADALLEAPCRALRSDSLLMLTQPAPPSPVCTGQPIEGTTALTESALRDYLLETYALRLRSTTQRPGAVTLAVPEGTEHTVIERLEGQPGVKYVSFLVDDGG